MTTARKRFPIRPSLIAVALLISVAHSQPPDASLPILEREIARLSRIGGGVAGAAVIHLETGRRVSLRGGQPFPMASAYKIPIAVEVLTLVDQGKERLDRMVTLTASDLHPGSGTLTDLFNKPGVALSVRNLLELMLLISDNSATDVLLRLAGGGDAVTARMRALGIQGIHVSRPTARMLSDRAGVAALPPESEWTAESLSRLMNRVPAEERRRAMARFDADPRDTSTPDGMAALLERIHRRDLLKADSAELLLDILRRCRTGEARLKGILPAGTVVAHKTGSLAGTSNDVGIVTLPDNAGHLAIAVFIKSSERETAQRERAIAEIARAAHDFFLFHPTVAARNSRLDYRAMAARIVAALKPGRGERVLVPLDPGYFDELIPPLEAGLREAGAVVRRVDYSPVAAGRPPGNLTQWIEDSDAFLWLPYRAGVRHVTPAEQAALARWLDRGGARREIHFHWTEGSVLADGLGGEHSHALDLVYQGALDVDYAALSAAQDRAVTLLRSGTIRVRTPAGTDLSFRLGDRPFNKQDGDASAARVQKARVRVDREIELPAGVIRVAPIEETVTGRLVVPAARFGEVVARDIRMEFVQGRMTSLEAAENLDAVAAALDAGGESARRFREFGLGFNPKLQPPPGSRALPYFGYGAGVVRMSLGDNEELGGAVRGSFRRWLFFPDTTVEVDGNILVRDGKLALR